MSQLVAYYDDNPVDVKGKLEISQAPVAAAAEVVPGFVEVRW